MDVRPARPEDAGGLAEVLVRGWQQAYRGMMPQRYLDGLSVAGRTAIWRQRLTRLEPPRAVLVLEPAVAGFVTVDAGDDPPDGAVKAIYVRPGTWGRGGGQALMAAAVDTLRAAGFTEATLWVLTANERARRFYEAGGWRPDGATKVDRLDGFPLPEIRYRRSL
ncbi:GNAT family N-acetyltransferase [Actinoplanes sp. DH11]|uniref:GNAT family N-acetyltransferase n=1 Tax=Actinoplanes sp. DH11 TaxID=2857011 RepID=UPI001E3CAF94|nr:GNAT family N-acetyltransferase [Actinoplanes sp. DH11]